MAGVKKVRKLWLKKWEIGQNGNEFHSLEPNMVVIMDNASFHKSGKIRDLIESAGAELLYLPKYSPDLNPIEKCWRPLKIQIQKARKFCANFDEIMTYIFCKNRYQVKCN